MRNSMAAVLQLYSQVDVHTKNYFRSFLSYLSMAVFVANKGENEDVWICFDAQPQLRKLEWLYGIILQKIVGCLKMEGVQAKLQDPSLAFLFFKAEKLKAVKIGTVARIIGVGGDQFLKIKTSSLGPQDMV